jgi:hypothetical protein
LEGSDAGPSSWTVLGGGAKDGKKAGGDRISFVGAIDVTAAEIASADRIYIKIWSLTDDYLVYSGYINFNPSDVKKNKYIYKDKSGSITSFQLNLKKQNLKFTVRNVDLTGLSTPLFIDIEIGDYIGLIEIDKEMFKKALPLNFMMGHADTLRVDKLRLKPGRQGKGDALQVRGAITLANPPSMHLNDQEVILTWGSQTFIIPAGSFLTLKTGQWQCKKIPVNDGGIISANFNLNKCFFCIKLSGANINPKSGTVDFGIAFDGFDETVEATVR